MGQYKQGVASFTKDSTTVSGIDTRWSTYLSSGDFIAPTNTPIFHEISEVVSDTELMLKSEWNCDSESDVEYIAVTGLSTKIKLYKPSLGDLMWKENFNQITLFRIDYYLGAFLYHAKAQLIQKLGVLFSTAIKSFWVFDSVDDELVVPDKSGNGYDLIIPPANLLSYGYSGTCPYITFKDGQSFYVDSSSDFSFGNGTSDSAFSVISFIQPIDFSNSIILAKDGFVEQEREWSFHINANKIYAVCYDDSEDSYIGRFYNSDLLTSDSSSFHSYIFTKGTGSTSASIKIYRDGVQIDDANYQYGIYTAMEAGSWPVGNRYNRRDYWMNVGSYHAGIILVVGEELSTAKVKQVDMLFRTYAGVDVT